jgi:hypothetical protein
VPRLCSISLKCFLMFCNDPYTMCRHVQCSMLKSWGHFDIFIDSPAMCAMCLRKALDATKRNLSVLPGA